MQGVFAGEIVESNSYGFYFVLATAAVLPATLLFLWLQPKLKAVLPEG
jgi:hypothetical protein